MAIIKSKCLKCANRANLIRYKKGLQAEITNVTISKQVLLKKLIDVEARISTMPEEGV